MDCWKFSPKFDDVSSELNHRIYILDLAMFDDTRPS